MTKIFKTISIFVALSAFMVILSGCQNTDSSINKSVNENIPSQEQNKKVGPKIELEPDKFDFGEVKLTDVVGHNFLIKNSGDAPLEILRLSTSCGCTSAEMVDGAKMIAPGESASLRATFDPSVHKDNPNYGEVIRVVYIRTNDENNPETEIEIKANVLE